MKHRKVWLFGLHQFYEVKFMKCYKCSMKAVVKSDNKSFCNNCFCEIIEKRVRKEIRTGKLLSKHDNILVIDDGTEKSALAIFLLKQIIKDPTISFDVKKNSTAKDYGKVVLPWLLDDEAESYLKSMFDNNKKSKLIHGKKEIKPLVGVTRDEAINFAKIKKLKFAESKSYDKDVQEMIGRMDDKYPGTKFGILKYIKKER